MIEVAQVVDLTSLDSVMVKCKEDTFSFHSNCGSLGVGQEALYPIVEL